MSHSVGVNEFNVSVILWVASFMSMWKNAALELQSIEHAHLLLPCPSKTLAYGGASVSLTRDATGKKNKK